MASISQPGMFWLPTNPDQRVRGTVVVDDGGITLHTVGELLKPTIQTIEPQTIEGIVSEHHIKILECAPLKISRGLVSAEDQITWHCLAAFRGDQYEGDVPNRIVSAKIWLTSLEDWAHHFRGLDVTEEGDLITVSWSKSQAELAHRWGLGKVAIGQTIDSSREDRRGRVTTASAAVNTFFRLEFDQPQSWNAAIDAASSLQALVSIAKGEAPAIEKIEIEEATTTPHAHLSAFYTPVVRGPGVPIQHNPLFTLDELGGIEGVAKWLDVIRDRVSLRTGLLIDRYIQPGFITDRTGHLLIACEVYQRVRMRNPNQKVRLSTDILKPMLKHAGESFREWIGDPQAWTRKISDFRSNEGVAHFQQYESQLTDVSEIHEINQQLYMLAISCILSDCGFPESLANQVIERARSKWRIPL